MPKPSAVHQCVRRRQWELLFCHNFLFIAVYNDKHLPHRNNGDDVILQSIKLFHFSTCRFNENTLSTTVDQQLSPEDDGVLDGSPNLITPEPPDMSSQRQGDGTLAEREGSGLEVRTGKRRPPILKRTRLEYATTTNLGAVQTACKMYQNRSADGQDGRSGLIHRMGPNASRPRWITKQTPQECQGVTRTPGMC